MKITVAVALFLAALFAPLSGAQAQLVGQPFPMLPNGSNAVLPTAPNYLLGNATGQRFYANAYKGAVSGQACTWDSSHDVGDCINAARVAAYNGGSPLGYVVVPAGSFGQTVSLDQTDKHVVSIVGAGGPGPYGVCTTTITWIGSVGGTMTSFNPSGQNMVGGGIQGICFDGNSTAGTGIFARGLAHSRWTDIFISNVTANAVDADAADNANGGFHDNLFDHVQIGLSSIAAANANGWHFGQSATVSGSDSFNNIWIGGSVQYQNGTGFVCGAMDSNNAYGLDIQPISGGAGTSLDLLGHASNSLLACRSNNFRTSGGFGRDATTRPVAEAGTIPSGNNYIFQNRESGAAVPLINGAATLSYDTNEGVRYSNASTSRVTSHGADLTSGNLGLGSNDWLSFNSSNDGAYHFTAAGNDSNVGFVFDSKGTGTTAIRLPGFGAGCTLSNDGGTPNTVIDIAACAVAEDVSGDVMVPRRAPLAAYTKTTGAWVVGSGNGCLDTGAVASSTWYYLYQIQRSDTGVVDYLCTVTYGSPTMPASYGRKRYIGAFKTDGSSNILAFTQIGNEFVWAAPPLDLSSAALGTSSGTSLTLPGVPNGYSSLAHLRGVVFRAAGTSLVVFSSLSETDVGNTGGNSTAQVVTAGVSNPFGEMRLLTSAAQAIRGRASQSSTVVTANTVGWTDPQIAWPH